MVGCSLRMATAEVDRGSSLSSRSAISRLVDFGLHPENLGCTFSDTAGRGLPVGTSGIATHVLQPKANRSSPITTAICRMSAATFFFPSDIVAESLEAA
jgi:hypothetical protein